jgi:hypothetical protein
MMTIAKIKSRNKSCGFHFFEKGAMGFFNSRVFPKVYGERFFLTSERFDSESPEFFTIRIANPDGSIDTVSDFQQYRTKTTAAAAARAMAEEER